MAPYVPRFSVFKSKYADKYLRYIDESGCSEYRYVKFDGEDITSSLAKFSIEKAKTNPNLIHIRSCYSNKYLRRSSETADYIAAAADKREEDETKWSCTLFKPLQADSDDTILRFQHVQLGQNLWYNRSNNVKRGCLIARYTKPESDGGDLFKVINWESLVILPKYVVFKGDNGKYLRYRGEVGYDHLVFGCDDIGSTKVANEVFTNFDGSLRVKLLENGKFWEATPNWIYPISTATSAIPSTNFWPVNLGEAGKANIIALKSMGNDRFLRRTNYGGTVDSLAAASWATTIDSEGHLQVEEPLVSRKIYDVEFNLDNLRVYSEQIELLTHDEDVNKTDKEKNSQLELKYTDTRTSSYKTSSSVKLGVKMEFKASIPIIEGLLNVGIESSFSVAYGKKYSWGEQKTQSSQLSATFGYVIPPKTKVKVEMVATKGICDIPFSYAQRDTYTDGKQVTYIKDDGVYTGSNYFGFNFMVKEEPISA